MTPSSLDDPPRRSRPRRRLLVAAAVGTGLVLVAGGAVAWNALSRPTYTALPEVCSELLPPEVMAGVPGLEGAEPEERHADFSEPGVLASLGCAAGPGGADPGEVGDGDGLLAHLILYDPEHPSAVEDMRDRIGATREVFEAGRPEDPGLGARMTHWRIVSAGDGGTAAFTRKPGTEPDSEDRSWISATYATGNIKVVLMYFAGDSVRELDGLDVVEAVAEGVAERIPGLAPTR